MLEWNTVLWKQWLWRPNDFVGAWFRPINERGRNWGKNIERRLFFAKWIYLEVAVFMYENTISHFNFSGSEIKDI